MSGLESYREALRYLQSPAGKQYKTVVIDSITETQAAILADIMREVHAQDDGRDEFAPQFSEWGKLTGVMRSVLRSYRDLETNVVFTALIREDEDELSGRVKVRPRLTPALSEEVPGFMDAVIYLGVSTPKKGEVGPEGIEANEEGVTVVRNGLLRPTGMYAAKVRSPLGEEVPDFITDPTFDDIAALMVL